MGTKAIKRQTRLHFTTSNVCSPFFSSCLLNRSFLQTRRTRRIASSYKTQDRFHSILHFFRLNAIAYITLVLCTLSLQKKCFKCAIPDDDDELRECDYLSSNPFSLFLWLPVFLILHAFYMIAIHLSLFCSSCDAAIHTHCLFGHSPEDWS